MTLAREYGTNRCSTIFFASLCRCQISMPSYSSCFSNKKPASHPLQCQVTRFRDLIPRFFFSPCLLHSLLDGSIIITLIFLWLRGHDFFPNQPSSRLLARSHFSNQDFETTMIVTLTMEIYFALCNRSLVQNVGQTRALAFFIQTCNVFFFLQIYKITSISQRHHYQY